MSIQIAIEAGLRAAPMHLELRQSLETVVQHQASAGRRGLERGDGRVGEGEEKQGRATEESGSAGMESKLQIQAAHAEKGLVLGSSSEDPRARRWMQVAAHTSICRFIEGLCKGHWDICLPPDQCTQSTFLASFSPFLLSLTTHTQVMAASEPMMPMVRQLPAKRAEVRLSSRSQDC